MRDYLIIAIIFGALPFTLRWPYIGGLLWAWISYANPHRYTWQFRDFPVAMLVSVVTVIALVFSREPKRIAWTRETFIFFLLWGWFALTTQFAFYPDAAQEQLDKVSKILFMTVVTLVLFQDKRRFDHLFIVIAISLGAIAFWGMIWGVMNAGQMTYYGPSKSFIEDNNDLALALNMMLPLCIVISRNANSRLMRIGFLILFVATVGTVVLTFSRGGFLGLIVVLFGLLLRSRKRIQAGLGIVILVITGLMFIPERWFERMSTIKAYESDASALGRINAWWVAIHVAQDRPLIGGGFEMFTDEQFLNYAPDPLDVHDVHSIYFEIMGEHGFAGFVIYLSLMASAMLSLLKMSRRLRNVPGFEWYVNYSDMLLLSIFAFLVNGATLGRAYFDLYFHLIAGVILLKVILRKELAHLMEEKKVVGDEGDFRSKGVPLVQPSA